MWIKRIGLALLGIMCAVLLVSTATYKREATIVHMSSEYVEFEDTQGHIWRYDGEIEGTYGDKVTLVMKSNGTTQIYDDEICKIVTKN